MSLLQRPALRRLQVRPGASLTRAGSIPSTRRHLSFAEVTMSTAESIAQVHQAGVPWWMTIPLVAAGINFSIRLPLQAYSRTLQNKRVKVQPLLDGWAYRHSRATRNEQKRYGKAARLLSQSRGRIYKVFGCQYWKSITPLLGSIPFITVTAAVRELGGAAGMSDPYSYFKNDSIIDPSIAEGGLGWFVDLTSRDPYLVLPVACSVLLAAQIFRGMSHRQILEDITNTNQQAVPLPLQLLRRIVLVFPLVPLFMFNAPAAMFLYWTTTFGLTHVNLAILDRLLPTPKRTLRTPQSVEHLQPWIHSSILDPPKTDEHDNDTKSGNA